MCAATALAVVVSPANAEDTSTPAAAPSPVVVPLEVGLLVYASDRKAECFDDAFLAVFAAETGCPVREELVPTRLDGRDLWRRPVTVWAGDASFALTDTERANLRDYLLRGGFVLASAACSSRRFDASLRAELAAAFPDAELTPLPADHRAYTAVFDVPHSRYLLGGTRRPPLYGLRVAGRTALVYGPDGLNNTDRAGDGCCCCGGDEPVRATELNVNILATALLP